MISRRDSLRLFSLSALALAAAPTLAACGGSSSEGPSPSVAGLDLVAADVARSPGSTSDLPAAVAALDRLGGSVLGQVAAQEGNVALSPYSIGVALAMTLNGAVGETQRQLLALFGDETVGRLNGGLDALTTAVEGLAGPVENDSGTSTEVALAAANALFGQRGEQWRQPFLDALARSYGAGVQTVDFDHATEAARTAVNTWTAQHTADRIPEIVPAGGLDPMTRLVLVNALYLKAPWATAFEKDATRPGPFDTGSGTVQVPMMSAGDVADGYARGDGWQAARLPYAGHGLAMTVVVPDAGRFAAVQDDVAAHGVASYVGAVRSTPVQLSLPSWTFRTSVPLSGALQALGATDAFDGTKADFSGMTTQDQLYVGEVFHQVYVAVDESGTEAAATTAVVMEASSARLPGASLTVDRPFLFVVHDVAHGTPLFLGRVTDPTA